MLLKLLYMYIIGIVNIYVEGFFIERFINICKNENIILWDLTIEKGTILRAKIKRSDFINIRHIAKKTSCRVRIDGKKGLPFVIKKYRKRKIFVIAILLIAFFCFCITRFIWNIEIEGNNKISKEEILSELSNYGIAEGKLKSNLDLDKIKNDIRLKRKDLSWIGINIKGTNAIVKIVEATERPEIIENKPSNIIANKSGIVSKMIVRQGTPRKNIRRYGFRRRFVS